MRSTFFKEKGGAKNLPIGKRNIFQFIIENGFDTNSLGSGYRVARPFSNFNLAPDFVGEDSILPPFYRF
jgi:hypothetical protein